MDQCKGFRKPRASLPRASLTILDWRDKLSTYCSSENSQSFSSMRRAVSVASASSAVALRGYVPANPFSRHAYTSRILLGSASAASQDQQRARPVATVGTGKVPQAAKLASPANFFAVQGAATKGSTRSRWKTFALSRVFSEDGGGGGGWRKSSSLSAQVFGPTPDTSWVSVTKVTPKRHAVMFESRSLWPFVNRDTYC